MPKREEEYEVGYGKPPKATRFKPGQSGNPRGRPKSKKNAHSIVEAVLFQPVAVTRNGRRTIIPAIEAGLTRILKEAIGGETKSVAPILKLLQLREAMEAREAAGPSDGEPSAEPRKADETDLEVLRQYADLLREGGSLDDLEDLNGS
ncbi:DUF5681 domain-containing protein [Histidinibacterium aquaticum]|uniref:DUF5681 domain-containing protein n=1 Tax=Histidinibacterium aquaticum TaxID=2613962 RepID=A0A5J5GMA3_9RHOB|nr:DUF5681 domain-containing protein [Histidinibacterium aquaticum]KAA9008748.1 hypothetical protein F3S47_05635 [Histidinibacterium aquaticum]